ncbi:MAG: hypothetical protein R3Y13_02380 [bacterium]
MNYFVGHYEYKLGKNNLIKIPKVYHTDLDDNLVIVRSVDKNLCIYNESVYSKLNLDDSFIISTPKKIDFNADYQFSLEEDDKEFLELDSYYVICGVADRLEIFSLENFKKLVGNINHTDIEDMFNSLSM